MAKGRFERGIQATAAALSGAAAGLVITSLSGVVGTSQTAAPFDCSCRKKACAEFTTASAEGFSGIPTQYSRSPLRLVPQCVNLCIAREILNLKAAKVLGIAVPASILVRADEVIK